MYVGGDRFSSPGDGGDRRVGRSTLPADQSQQHSEDVEAGDGLADLCGRARRRKSKLFYILNEHLIGYLLAICI